MSAREDTGAFLYERLRAVDPKLAELFSGGWETLNARADGHIESACHLMLEVLQRSLRTLAPDDEVEVWAKANNQRRDDIVVNGKVTRLAKVRYLSRNRMGERKLISAELEAVSKSVEEIVNRLNAGKHASAADFGAVRANFAATESILLRILD